MVYANIKERDLHHLKSIGYNEKTQKRILTDIYGCQQDVLQQNGLADAGDEVDLSNLPEKNWAWTAGLELKHKLQKKRLREDEIPKEVARVSSTLEKWVAEFYVEEERALRGLGKYRLAPGYDQFQVDPVKWNKWGPERQSQHLSAFRNFIPKSFNT